MKQRSLGRNVSYALCFAALMALLSSSLWSQTDWPAYGHDPGGMRYSPLKQIDTRNAAKLQLAWKYDTNVESGTPEAPTGPGAPRRNFARLWETTPLVIGNVMYMSTSHSRVVALDSATGVEIWKYQSPGIPAYRGISFWPGDKVYDSVAESRNRFPVPRIQRDQESIRCSEYDLRRRFLQARRRR